MTSSLRRGWAAWVVAGMVLTVPLAWSAVAARHAGTPHASLHIRGTLHRPLRPGASQRLDLTLVNRRRFGLTVTSVLVRASVDARHRRAGCTRRDYAIRPIPRRIFPLVIGPRSSAVLGVSSPRVRMKDLRRNQDACKGARLRMRYLGLAHRAT